MKIEQFFELLISYYEGNMSETEFAEELGLSLSTLKHYLDKTEKVIIHDYKLAGDISNNSE
ncbi:unnamed protein product [marine sediment metagenome]|uniref:Helix-turn-helix type 11 domain-containing protein n=1 Tax=marine sediment metagenome TaxID=412755 RepID=X1ST91_9ZZZZ